MRENFEGEIWGIDFCSFFQGEGKRDVDARVGKGIWKSAPEGIGFKTLDFWSNLGGARLWSKNRYPKFHLQNFLQNIPTKNGDYWPSMEELARQTYIHQKA